VVASAVGGIGDQIEEGVHGMLVHDPTDPSETAGAIARLLADEDLARALGRAAHERVVERYLLTRSFLRWADLLRMLLGPADTST
jgi:glycosyltransferase involved in cell wall biosynthesis